MDKKKLVPIIVLVILVIILGIILYTSYRNNETFTSLNVSYNSETITHDNLSVNSVVVINNVSFWIVSTAKNSIVIHSSEKVTYNNKEIEELEIKMNKTYEVCFENSTCGLFELK